MNEFTKEELENEIWKDVPEYEGMYQVSDLGRVKSLSREILNKGKYPSISKGKILKPSVNKGGYYKVNLCKNGKGKNRTIHQLVAMAFLNHVPCGHLIEVNHKDEDKANNRLINLEVLTKKEHLDFTHRNSTSKYRGVSFDKKIKKWQARITINGKTKGLGYFHTELEAHEAVQKAEERAKNGNLSFMEFREKTSKYNGVSFYKQKNKWRAQITINGKRKHLGYFPTELEAHKAVQKSLENLN